MSQNKTRVGIFEAARSLIEEFIDLRLNLDNRMTISRLPDLIDTSGSPRLIMEHLMSQDLMTQMSEHLNLNIFRSQATRALFNVGRHQYQAI